jgi:hypothetical protein
MGTNTLRLGDQAETLVFTTSDGEAIAMAVDAFWRMVSRISTFRKLGLPSAKQRNVDFCTKGWWFRGRFFANGNSEGPQSGVTWAQVADELQQNRAPGGISTWQTPHYPLWVEDRIIREMKTQPAP